MDKLKFPAGSDKGACNKAMHLEGALESFVKYVSTKFDEQETHIRNLEKRIKQLEKQCNPENEKQSEIK